jgi:cell division protein FtsQ
LVFRLAIGVALVVCASVGAAWGARRYVVSTSHFSIRQLEIDGSKRKSDLQVAQLAGIETGSNIFALDLDNAERRLLEDPWIRQVTITRRLPTTLQVQLSEHEAGALVVIDGRLYLVTPTGEPFKQLEDGDPFDLPVVTGVQPENLSRDRPREVARIRTALQVLRHYHKLRMSGVHGAQEVHLTDGGGLVLTVGKTAITLHLGRGPWRQKLLMAERVMDRLRRKGRVPGIVFLDNQAHPERVVVRMR